MTKCDLSHLCDLIIYMIDYRDLVASGWLRTCGFFCGSVWGRAWYRSRAWSSGIYMFIYYESEARTPHGNLEFVDCIVEFFVDEHDNGREHGHQVYVCWCIMNRIHMKGVTNSAWELVVRWFYCRVFRGRVWYRSRERSSGICMLIYHEPNSYERSHELRMGTWNSLIIFQSFSWTSTIPVARMVIRLMYVDIFYNKIVWNCHELRMGTWNSLIV